MRPEPARRGLLRGWRLLSLPLGIQERDQLPDFLKQEVHLLLFRFRFVRRTSRSAMTRLEPLTGSQPTYTRPCFEFLDERPHFLQAQFPAFRLLGPQEDGGGVPNRRTKVPTDPL